MDELAAAQVQAAVGGSLIVGLEEYQVAGHQFLGTLGAQAQLVLLIGGAGDIYAVLSEDELKIAGAVKSLGGSAAELVGHADVGFCRGYQRADLALGQDRLAVGSHGAFGPDGTVSGFRLWHIHSPGAGLGFFQGPPGGIIHYAGDADFLIPLEFGDGSFCLGSVDSVQILDLIAYAVQPLLQHHDFVSVAALLERGGGVSRQLGGGEDDACRQRGQEGFQMRVLASFFVPLAESMYFVQGIEHTESRKVTKGTKVHRYRPFWAGAPHPPLMGYLLLKGKAFVTSLGHAPIPGP